jgi:hypothetical protein
VCGAPAVPKPKHSHARLARRTVPGSAVARQKKDLSAKRHDERTRLEQRARARGARRGEERVGVGFLERLLADAGARASVPRAAVSTTGE